MDHLITALMSHEIAGPLVASVIAGALIGAEREYQGKPAGLRTHTLVCFSSALMTLAGLMMADWTYDLPPGAQIVSDMARMPHAILTGVGFLGAGVIFREGASVQGLTTAASLWLTAALGIVFGTGLIELALTGTAVACAVLLLMRLLQGAFPAKPDHVIELTVDADRNLDAAGISKLLGGYGVKTGDIAVRHDVGRAERHFSVLAGTEPGTAKLDTLCAALLRIEGLRHFNVTPIVGIGEREGPAS